MANELSEFGPKGCPYLGLEEDRSVMLLDASPLHRCFSDPKENYTPTLQYQTDVCLCEAHGQCPRFQRAAPLGDVVKPPPRPKRAGEGGNNWLLPTVGGVVVLALLGWVAFSLLGGRNATPGVTPTEVAVAAATDAATAAAVTPPSTAAAGEPVAEDAGGQAGQATADASQANAPGATDGVTGTAGAGTPGGDTASAGTTVAAVSDPATEEPTPTQTPTPTAENAGVSLFSLVTPTPIAGGADIASSPRIGGAGWWQDQDPNRGSLNDSFLYAGTLNGANYIGAATLDLSRVARGAAILQGELTLTGLRDEQLDRTADASWLVQLIGADQWTTLSNANFMQVYSAPAAITLLPQLTAAEIGPGKVNRWELDAATLQWIEQQRLDGATSIGLRVIGTNTGTANTLFGWDSGLGGASGGNGPRLSLQVGPAPTETPPLPTRDFIVATFTPAPANVLTLVAQQQTATAVAATIGTYTPVPYFVTPTPQPQNLATVQAAAVLAGLPAVLLETPVPANEATATELANYATAVAETTGTFTPVPTAFVTPFKVLPSPPAESAPTEVARNAEATAAALIATPTPLPYNAVIAQYVIATVTPQNVATAAVLVREATAQAQLVGTATPTPWEWVVLNPTPLPVEPSPTPTPTLPPLLLESQFTPTPTPLPMTAEPIPDSLPAEFVNKILFKTNRTGEEEVFVFDPATSSTVGKVTRNWVYPMAVKQLAVSPDGKNVAVVKPDEKRVLQIYVRSLEYGTDKQITNFTRDSYDPTWSPTGEWIAFVGTNTGNDEVYRVTPDGQTVQQLTFNSYEWDKHPTWSPDGTQIVWYSNRETGRRQLWIMDADGSGQRNLTGDEYENWDPIWTR